MNIAVAQSGGPTCAINASLLGVFRHAVKYDKIETVYGSVNGIEGLIYGNLVNQVANKVNRTSDSKTVCRNTLFFLALCQKKQRKRKYKKWMCRIKSRNCEITFDAIKTALQTKGGFVFGINSTYFNASETATAQATVIPTIGLLPAPIRPIIST